MPNYVQFFKSTDLNAPAVQTQAGSLIAGMFNACLVDGYGDNGISITGITRSGTTATATCSAYDILRLKTGNILTISGAAQSDYNITATITLASSTTFTYTVANSPTTPATGTIVFSKRLPVPAITYNGTIALAQLTNANSTLYTGTYVTVAGATGGDAGYYNGTFRINFQTAWAASTVYTLGSLVVNDSGKLYICRTAGTSNSSGGPTGTSTAISDGSVSWDYVAASGNANNYFSYEMTSTPSGNATGTLVYYKAGLQWTRPFSAGTNSQTYRSPNTSTNQFYVQVIDNAATAGGALEAAFYGAEVMSSDQNVTSGRFPTVAQISGGTGLRKGSAVNTTQRDWYLWGDDRRFDGCINTADGVRSWATFGFGHFDSTKPGDAFNTLIYSANSFNNNASRDAMNLFPITSSNGMVWIARSYTQTGSATQSGFSCLSASGSGDSNTVTCLSGGTGTGGGGLIAFPHGPDSGLYITPILVIESGTVIRGTNPGMYSILQNVTGSIAHYDESTGIAQLPGKTFIHPIITTASSNSSPVGRLAIDKFGPF